ncbi:MAG: fasciclin domain-containing protein [Chloroflexota bacterium]|nr:fasciclin domain-containing protein [Chloroflexota bacterium]
MRKGILVVLSLLLALSIVVPALAQDRPNLVDVLESDEDGRFSTLVAAIDAAGLRPLLNSSSAYTIFAPTNDAITASLDAISLTVADLLADNDTLQEILLYHVVPGRIRSSDLFRGETLRTMSGQDLTTGENEGGQLTAAGVVVGQANIAAGNGFVHVLDAGILVPPSLAEALTPPAVVEEPAAPADTRPTVAQILADDGAGRFTTLLAAVEAAGLTETLSGEGNFTVLAPTNEAFDAALAYLGVEASDLLADTATLTDVLLYHVLGERTRSSNLFVGGDYTTLNGATLTFGEAANGTLTVNSGAATVLDANLVGSNGVVHAIDAVLLPPDMASAAQANRANIRVAHFSPDAGPVDIYINGELSDLQGVAFSTVSPWIEVAANAYSIGIAPAGGEPTGVVIANVAPGSWTTIAAVGIVALDNLDVRFLLEDYSPIPDGTARVSVFHAIQGAGVIDVRLNGSVAISTLGYPGSLGDNDGFSTVNVNAGPTDIQIVPNGATTPVLISDDDFPFNAGTNYLVAAVGTPSNPSLVVVAVPQ